jgi:hypothetical protein
MRFSRVRVSSGAPTRTGVRGCVAQRVRKDNFMLHYDQLEVRVQLPMQHHLQHGGDAIAGVPHGLPR